MKKEKIVNIIFYVALGLIIIILLIAVINKFTGLNSETPIVKDAYALLGDEQLEYCDGLPYYADNEVNYDTLSDKTKKCLAFRYAKDKVTADKLDKTKKTDYCYLDKAKKVGFRTNDAKESCDIQIITKEDLNNAYIAIFGKNIEEYTDFAINGSQSCYFNEEKGSYTCGNVITQTLEIGWNPTTYRMIYKIKEKDNQLIIYDYYLNVNNEKCFLTNNGTKENEKCSDKFTSETKVNGKFVSKYGKKYIHTFEKENGSYHWVSSIAK